MTLSREKVGGREGGREAERWANFGGWVGVATPTAQGANLSGRVGKTHHFKGIFMQKF